MKISGFTMVRNATKLYYPVKESIESILPICDEFIVALGNCDENDRTEQEIASIKSDKIKIVRTVWDTENYKGGTVYAQQTDIAKSHCTGDWLFYLQSDEVVHEKYLPVIVQRCEQFLNDLSVEGLLFRYKHFWGDYDHYIVSHSWYPQEIRIIRNNPEIHSWRDAQSFRKMPDFDGKNYFQKRNTAKLKVAKVDACIFHYGWVRPPSLMQKKRKTHITTYKGEAVATRQYAREGVNFNYGDMTRLETYKGTHPGVLKNWIEKFDWSEDLERNIENPHKHKHDKIKYRVLTFIEQNFLGGRLIGGFKNYKLLSGGIYRK
jgi:hypothetical protein